MNRIIVCALVSNATSGASPPLGYSAQPYWSSEPLHLKTP
jgi:hypothetical protein